MKTNEMDKLISEALSTEEAEFYNQLQEQSVPEMLGGLFQGKMKWLNVMMVVGMMITFSLAVFCAVQFLKADEMIHMFKWGAGAFLFWMAVGFIKLIQFMQINNNTLLRELKKLELQQAILASKINASLS